MIKEKKTFQPLKSNLVCEIYKLLHNKDLIAFPITKEAENKVDSLVFSINSKYFGKEIYPSIEEKAVAYLYFIIKNHPFTDGNKRTAALSFEVVCKLNDLKPNYGESSLDEFAVYIEKQRTSDYQSLIKNLSKILFS